MEWAKTFGKGFKPVLYFLMWSKDWDRLVAQYIVCIIILFIYLFKSFFFSFFMFIYLFFCDYGFALCNFAFWILFLLVRNISEWIIHFKKINHQGSAEKKD